MHKQMRHIILLGLLLAFTTSCKNHPDPASTKEDSKAKEVKRLLAEAGSLWIPPSDSTFILKNDSEHVSINDKEIWAKLDSALATDPSNIKVYMGRISYLLTCKKFYEILPILRQAEKQTIFNADLWSIKAIFEDYYGDSLIARRNYQSADSAYAILIEEHATDSLSYAAHRMSRALNKALMTDNFAPFEEEVELTKKVFPETWEGADKEFYGKSKKEFYEKFFTTRGK